MKKTYITPTLMQQRIYGTYGFMENLSLNDDTENALEQNEILVKRHRPSDYNVWDDDWTK